MSEEKRPVCSHPELRPTTWDQPKPEPAEMTGCCVKNLTCPVCGFGWGAMPCDCTRDIQRNIVKLWVNEAAELEDVPT